MTLINDRYPSIVRGNRAILRINLLADNQPVSDLASAIGARFVALRRHDRTIEIDKALTDMSVDDPQTGTVSITLSSTETDIEAGTFDIAIQFTWGAGDVLEWNFPESLSIVKGLIP